MRTVPVSGVYYRVADPDWPDPLDPSYAAAASGQRWNPPGLACLYLSCDETTARANVTRLFFGLPYGPEDPDPATAPLLLTVELPNGDAADAFTDLGPRRAARRADLLSLQLGDRRSGYPLEMFLKASLRGWRITELPVVYAPRTGKSKVTGTVLGTVRAVRDMSAQLRAAAAAAAAGPVRTLPGSEEQP